MRKTESVRPCYVQVFTVLVLTSLFLSPGTADEIELYSGKTLKGTVIERTDQQVVIELREGERKTVERSDIESFVLVRTKVTLPNSDSLTGRVVSRSKQQLVLDIENGGEVVLLEDNIEQIETVEKRYAGLPPGKEIPMSGPAYWSGEMNLGYTIKRGNSDEDDFYARGRVAYNRKPINNETSAQFNYANSEDETTEDRGDLENQLNYSLNSRAFLFNDLTVGYDDVRDLDYFIDTAGGVGVEFLVTSPSELKVRSGPSYRFEKRDGSDDETEMFVLIGESFRTKLNERITLRQDLKLFPSITDSGEYRQEASVELKIALVGNWSLNLYGEQIYDSDPVPGTEEQDLRFVTTLGYSF